MSIKTTISALLLLSATTLPALAEDYARDPARADAAGVVQAPLFGGIAAGQPGTATRHEARNAKQVPTLSDATSGSSVPAALSNPHMYDYLSGPEYRGGQ
jgi:hypothetical protein